MFSCLIILLLCGVSYGLVGRATAIPRSSTWNCSAECIVGFPYVHSVYWTHTYALDYTLIAAFTVVTIINTQQNLTRYTTETAQLPDGYTVPPTNENGTRTCVLQMSKATDQPVPLAYPTIRESTGSTYWWDGRLSTTINGTDSGCLSTNAGATLHSPLPPTQYIDTDVPFTDDPYGLNYDCTTLSTVATWIYGTEDEAALQSCYSVTEGLSYSFPYLTTAAWLTVASSTSYESDIMTTTGADSPTSSQPISPSPHSTVALPTPSAQGTKSSSFTLELSHKQSVSRTDSTGFPGDTTSSSELSVSRTSHPIIISHSNSFRTTSEISRAPPLDSSPTLQPFVSSSKESTSLSESPTSQPLPMSGDTGATKQYSGVQLASTVIGQTAEASSTQAGYEPTVDSSALLASSIDSVTSRPVPIATTFFSTSTIYSTSFSISVTTNKHSSTSKVVATQKVSVSTTVVPVITAETPETPETPETAPTAISSLAGRPSVPISSGIDGATSALTPTDDGGPLTHGSFTNALGSGVQNQTGASSAAFPIWSSAGEAGPSAKLKFVLVCSGLLWIL